VSELASDPTPAKGPPKQRLANGNAGKRGGALPDFIDWPQTNPPRRRLYITIIVIVAAFILFGGRTALSYWVDLLWFRSLGYAQVCWKTLSLQCGIFTAFAVATFVILYGALSALKQAHRGDLPSGPHDFHQGKACQAHS
jgi:hypothetical protein